MDTTEIMNLSIEMAGFNDIPADSHIFYPGKNISRILFGIDIWPKDLEYARKNGFDLVISHHPPFMIFNKDFLKVLDRHIEIMETFGVSGNKAQKVLSEVRQFWLSNSFIDCSKTYDEVILQAQKLNMPLMNIHLACDEIGRVILQKKVNDLGINSTVSDLIGVFEEIPEIKKSWENVSLICGSFQNRVGKTAVVHGTGANGGYAVANALFESGIETVVYITFFSQQREDGKRLREENRGNLIITGHYASDSIGVNVLIDELKKKGIDIECCNRLIR